MPSPFGWAIAVVTLLKPALQDCLFQPLAAPRLKVQVNIAASARAVPPPTASYKNETHCYRRRDTQPKTSALPTRKPPRSSGHNSCHETSIDERCDSRVDLDDLPQAPTSAHSRDDVADGDQHEPREQRHKPHPDGPRAEDRGDSKSSLDNNSSTPKQRGRYV